MIKPLLIVLIFILIAFSCIEPYSPDLGESAADRYVIFGQLTSQEGFQTVDISLASDVSVPEYKPFLDCQVSINDDKGNSFDLQETGGGKYRVWMSSADLQPGTSFQLHIITPSGVLIESEYDKMPECPDIDSVYYTLEASPPENPAKDLPGIMMYLDLNAENSDSHYFRWDLTETWERHSIYPVEWWYDHEVHHTLPPDYSLMTCWNTEHVNKILTLTTENFARNEYKRFPLFYLGNNTSRLSVKYSLNITQYAMSRAGYDYWDQLRTSSSAADGLYQKQPLPVRGNLNIISGPEREILGTFNAVSFKQKRIFVDDVPGLELDYEKHCSPPHILDRNGFESSRGADSILYFLVINGVPLPVDGSCVNCLSTWRNN